MQASSPKSPSRRFSACELTEKNVHFAFPNGRLTYDCASCNAACCRGHGYVLGGAAETNSHLHYRPNLHLFAMPSDEVASSAFVTVRNCPPACFFLTKEGQCGIQVEHGYAAKPETCRLFPFNHFARVGTRLVVSPHPSLCPLQVTPFGTISDKSRHDLLLSELQLQGIGGPVPTFHAAGSCTDSVLAVEREIRECAESVGDESDYLPFTEVQLDLALSLPELPGHLRAEAERAKSQHALQEFLCKACQVLQVNVEPDLRASGALVRVMVAATPQLRSHMLFHSGNMRSGEELPALVLRLPYLMLALFVFAMAAQSAGMAAITVQTLSHLLRSNASLLRMIGSSNRVLIWRPGVLIPSSFPGDLESQRSYFRVVKALLANNQRRRMRTLADVINESCALQGTERMRFLILLSGLLAERVVTVPEARTARARLWRRVRCAVQRTGLAITSEDQLSSAASRQGH